RHDAIGRRLIPAEEVGRLDAQRIGDLGENPGVDPTLTLLEPRDLGLGKADAFRKLLRRDLQALAKNLDLESDVDHGLARGGPGPARRDPADHTPSRNSLPTWRSRAENAIRGRTPSTLGPAPLRASPRTCR